MVVRTTARGLVARANATGSSSLMNGALSILMLRHPRDYAGLSLSKGGGAPAGALRNKSGALVLTNKAGSLILTGKAA